MQTAFDFSPLYRSSVGFDRLFNMLESMTGLEPADNFPPYNIEVVGEDAYRIRMAVAGFAPKDLTVTVEPNLLVVAGGRQADDQATYLHRGLALRSFTRRFQLADHVKVAEARLENGLLTIDLVREIPESLKPRRIEITADTPAKTIEHEPAKKVGSASNKAA